MIQTVFYRPYLTYLLQIYCNTHTTHLYHSQPLQGSLSSRVFWRGRFQTVQSMKYESLHPCLLQAPISGLLCESKSQTCKGRTPLPQQTVGWQNCSCPAFIAFGQWSGKSLFILIHVFSVLLLAHETEETAAEEKYLIYTMEKTLLWTGLYGKPSLCIFFNCKLLLQKKNK